MSAAQTLDAILKMNNRGQELCEKRAQIWNEIQALGKKIASHAESKDGPLADLIIQKAALDEKYIRLDDKISSMSRF